MLPKGVDEMSVFVEHKQLKQTNNIFNKFSIKTKCIEEIQSWSAWEKTQLRNMVGLIYSVG